MKHKRKNKRKKPFRSAKRNRPNERVDCLLDGGAGMGADSDSTPITDKALEPDSAKEKNLVSNAGDGHGVSPEGAGSGCTDARVSARRAPDPSAGVHSSNTPPPK